ncbi:MAG: hypothetical protein M3Q44_00175 [bacterium]|nr:hypothetical protein [bacterium]
MKEQIRSVIIPNIDRRTAIKRVVLGGGLGLGALILTGEAYRRLPSSENDSIRLELEKKYNIELKTQFQVHNEANKRFPGSSRWYYPENDPDQPPRSWDVARLKLIDTYLSILAPNFCESYAGYNTRIVLGDKSTFLSEYITVPDPVLTGTW